LRYKHSGECKKAMAKKRENDDQHKSFLEAITAYEQAKLAGHRNCKKPHALHVTVRQEAQMRTTMCMGYFWPCKVYESHFKKAVDKKRLEVCTHNGVKYKGVFLPPATGRQPGVMQLDSIGVTGVSKSRELASSDDESDNAETKFASGRKRGALAAKIRPADAEGEESIQVQAVEKNTARPPTAIPTMSLAAFGNLWCTTVPARATSGRTKKTRPLPRRRPRPQAPWLRGKPPRSASPSDPSQRRSRANLARPRRG
jgi:hypothetical protein